jgi:hypothetical protein
MENHYRIVIDLYKKCFTDYMNGTQVDASSLIEVVNIINFAIDKAKINDLPTSELECLKEDVQFLRYQIL